MSPKGYPERGTPIKSFTYVQNPEKTRCFELSRLDKWKVHGGGGAHFLFSDRKKGADQRSERRLQGEEATWRVVCAVFLKGRWGRMRGIHSAG